MTQKEIFAITNNEDAMMILREIEEIQKNLCHKTIYERKTATRKMKALAKELLEEIKEGK